MTNITISETALADFTAQLHGKCITDVSSEFDQARSVWNASIDKKPAFIVRCMGVADVMHSVRFARTHKLLVAVRGGGHNVAGNATCDDGMVIDLGRMNAVHTDVLNQSVRVEGGATIGDVDRETQLFGLAVPLGIVSETGIGGLTLCGGHSWLTRLHGFACDNLISMDIITAEGDLVTASEAQNPDLLWALKGGGGNFGIVVSFKFKAHQIGNMVTFCAPFYPMENAAEIMRFWRDHMKSAPDKFTGNFTLWSIPAHENFPPDFHGKPVAIPTGVYCGPEDEAMEFIQPLRDLGEPLFDLSGPIPYAAVQQAFDPYFSSKEKRLNYWKSLFMDELSNASIDAIVARAKNRPDPWTLMAIRHLGGRGSSFTAKDSPLGGRDADFLMSIDTSWTDSAKSSAAMNWTQEFWDEMAEGTSGRAYLNFLSQTDNHENLLRASYGEDVYTRLKSVKTKYDPSNFFSLNQNIPPQ
ncbi:MAG: FAD-binding oxidoreductase [Rhizobiales bacterium]|nr:FAD-binding oxidoreductase [Hyphomicrobiales bacterium]